MTNQIRSSRGFYARAKALPLRLLSLPDWLSSQGRLIAAISVLIMTLTVSYEVVARYVFQKPTHWSADVSGYLDVIIIFLAAGCAAKEGAHISADMLTAHLPEKARRLLFVITSILSLVFVLILAYEGSQLTVDAYVHHWMEQSSLEVPMYLPYSLIPLGASLLALQLVATVCRAIRSLVSGARPRDAGQPQ